ncbi:PREDICTED: uncharacterized protein LOC109158758 [Ipomoea nil]|uniref:uncharacterized protein LOC109158758 n=1 Tax=Ipomoea nil TaxID=35883 RepID=UPI000901E00F|nr:PREDICTED: uncharacterized protein LOC109158758 [Ipomoea nil]
MNPGFYQEYWDIVGGDVSKFIVNCLNSGSLPEGLNDTNVVLIPKKDVPETIADMRPIALSNVLYRIMAKVIANRMKPLMGNLISEAQSAFIPGRLITDNILIAAEVGHYLNRKQCGRKGWAALKLDMAKAYDRMEWQFLRRMLEWGCNANQGVAAGDPLSPYLFLICAKVYLCYCKERKYLRAMNKYWWGTGMDKGIHWKAWDKLSIPKKYGGMGFKDLKNFNLAMLGKQAWRLLTSPDTLVAKVYKARYYPNTTFVDAKVGGCPSHSWRSIMAAHDMVVAQVRRRIGDGKTTLIWGHPWLPDNPSPLVQTDMPVELRHAKVVGLIDEHTATWDPHILADLFEEEDVSRILRIPVNPGYEDSWYWPDDPNGIYTVKNAYRHIMGIYDHSPGSFEKWTKMWGMKIPPKWKTFLWRAVCDILPTTNNLIIKRVEGLPITNIVVNSFPEWLTIVLTMFTEDQSAAVVALLYCLWRCRNSAVWDGTLPRPTTAWRQATAALHSYRQVMCRGTAAPTTTTADGDIDSTPRCYVDAGYREDTGEATYGIVLLSPGGTFIAAKNGRLSNCLSPFIAEALACKEALSWLLEKNITTVTIQTDCLQLRNAIRQNTTIIMSYIGVVVDQCRTLASYFNYVLFNHVSRQINAHAHTLASLAFIQDQAMYWDSIPPDCIAALIH